MTRRRGLLAWAGAGLLGARAEAAHEGGGRWPSRPIRLIVVYPPGGVSDGMARFIAEPLSRALGVPVVVDNRPGAGGGVGMALLARAAPDGHTLAFSAITPLTLAPFVSPVPYEPEHAFAPVCAVMRTPVLVVGTPALPAQDFAQMLALARRAPGTLRWATTGVATTGHLVLVQTRALAQVDIVHVPYQGGGAQLRDALGGQFELLSTNVAGPQLRYVESGRLQALAVGAPGRLAALPRVPTLGELGLPGANLHSLFGIFAPARTAPAVVQRLNAEINRVMASAPLRARLREAFNLPAPGTPGDFAREIALDRERNRALAAAALHQLAD